MGYAVHEIAAERYGSDSQKNFDDVIEELGDEIAILAAHIHGGTYQFLEKIARFDRLRGWEPGGHRSCAHWLSYRTGLDIGTAREHVRVARALEELPRTSKAMSGGDLSFSQVRALTRVAGEDTEADLLELATGCTTAQLERMVRAWKKGSRGQEAAAELERHASRTLSVFPDDDGMYVIHGRLDPEVGGLLMRAIEAASDALYRSRRATHAGPDPRIDELAGEAARRRADAIGLLAERALSAGFRARDVRVPISGSRAERYQVVLHVDRTTLEAEGDPGRSELEDGTRVSAEASRRVSCDAGLVRIARGPDGSALDVGRRTRTIPPALRRALDARDRGCRFPGCGLRFTDAHHVVHWANGGATSLDNTVLLCRYHHRLVHEGGWAVESWGKGRLGFRDPRGSCHLEGRPKRARGAPAVGHANALVARNRRRGVDPGPWTASARWKREADIPDDVLFRAIEAGM